jgi:hypothetical protein
MVEPNISIEVEQQEIVEEKNIRPETTFILPESLDTITQIATIIKQNHGDIQVKI